MNEDIRKHLAALNAAWQRYARAIEQELDTIPMDALNRDFIAARKGLANASESGAARAGKCGI